MSLTIGIDIGGTKIAGGVVDADGAVVAQDRRESPAREPDAVAATVADLVGDLAADHAVTAVGVAAAGFVDRDRERVMFAPNLAWRDEPLRERIARRTGLPVVLDNDANAAAWAEYRFGAGHGAHTLAMITLGTGIGGGLVVDGELVIGGFGVAAEFGHLRMVPEGRRCACGLLGCWEAYGSGTGLRASARELAAAEPDQATALLALVGGDLDRIDGATVSAAADAGDPVALRSFAELDRRNGEGIAMLSAVVDPDVVIVGGGVAESPHISLDRVRTAFRAGLSGAGHRPEPELRLARLGNAAGMVGAADLARRRLAASGD